MRQALTALALFAAFATAAALYMITHDTRRIEARVHRQERHVERLEAEIAAARAEIAHLARPERIEPMARALGLGAPTRRQFVDEASLPRVKAAAP